MQLARYSFALLIIAAPAWAQSPPTPPPTDAQLAQQRITALTAEVDYMQSVIARMRFEWAASEERAKWVLDNWVPPAN